MKIGIGLPNQVRGTRPTVIPAWASRAEQAGFSTLGTVGRVAYPGVMDTVALAAAAATTTSIGLLSGIMLGPVWPPVLLATETAAIDAVSGGRLTLGMGVGVRPDDFVVDGLGMAARGRRFDQDLDVYRDVWRGEPVGGGPNPAVPPEAREIPLLFGGAVPASFERVARRGAGYIGGSVPAPMVAPAFDAVRAAWATAGREGSPHLVALAYFALGDTEQGHANVWDYYQSTGDEVARLITDGMASGPGRVKDAVAAFADIGADELILNPAVGDPDEIDRLADIVL
ncbi:LLM class flavin-dependent oxidoreductase [Actinoallomurus rhizosphaericola]|uniref:LLM class flavin-dependent oxidoreductase n=1 Tax=Actinoallomurus rhizosphaericola TaxID=2952536 RepID=UPI0020929BA7|nr:LLM class flavin-dependent oxidoreductase [Actinoallomurus rhizosphaericola]MCO5996678.1 LLM class flavin-dependent oxidoreductase [Actinoallomurus rhizosphaericola]